eukprot:CAMPEP_0184868884 /NCGR_PEP_ID=MMETSP0580-20130426/32056_1 /TAXON_ID=1118495 /ORGANISM="Dactyliosolen fragilissimus" /LENGTH=376 /DNA_ID=CAMNT_0027370043 /DNA_START=350 /DNA_END=1477 /DNA_ORIENTATION=-
MKNDHLIGYSQFLTRIKNRSSNSLNSSFVHGTWDDHDYGGNDFGANMPDKMQRLNLFLDFLDVPSSSPASEKPKVISPVILRRSRKGAYNSIMYGTDPHSVLITFLDTRFDRADSCLPNPGTTSIPLGSVLGCLTRWISAGLNLSHYFGGRLCFGSNRDYNRVLSEEQWLWLEDTLQNSTAQVNVVVSSIQVLTTNPLVESWGHYPEEKNRLLRLLSNIKGLLLLSGDVHHAEILDSQATSNSYPSHNHGIIEVTSSGLTHSCTDPFYGFLCTNILNRFHLHRFNDHSDTNKKYYYTGRNFGSININWGDAKLNSNSVEGDINLDDSTTIEVRLHDSHGYPVMTTGKQYTSSYSDKFSFESLEDVPGCIDGHLEPW